MPPTVNRAIQILVFISVATLLFDFNIRLSGSEVRLVAADTILPLFILGISLQQKQLEPIPASLPLVAMGAVLALACITGFYAHKTGTQPLVRFAGYFFLMGHMIVGHFWARRFNLLPVRLFLYAGAVMAACAYFDYVIDGATAFRAQGFFQNPNTFGIAMAVLGCLALVDGAVLFNRAWLQSALPALFGVNVLCSGSRSAMLGVVFGVVLLFVFKLLSWRIVIHATLIVLLLWGLGVEMPTRGIDFLRKHEVFKNLSIVTESKYLNSFFVQQRAEYVAPVPWLHQRNSVENYDSGRMAVIKLGLELWSKQPLLGIGLGSVFRTTTTKVGYQGAATIHNTTLWLLVETGVIGIAALCWTITAWWRHAWPDIKNGNSWPAGKALFVLLAVLFGASVGTEIFYQRYAWFLIGCFLALTNEAYEKESTCAA